MIRHIKATIAVVDGDAAVRKGLARVLSVVGYQTELYASAGEFFAAAATSNATCLLLDIPPNDMAGLKMVRRLSASHFRRPVIFMTGSGNELIRAQAEALCCSDYLLKPIGVTQLIEAIERATGGNSRAE
jgi:FixJ family two-component response regulator